ncbi:MAG: PAS domain S-box protein, partial [Proteobacteria bacterium]|nr:PAS domain S-box protein [Pseudomonadota bacterium]
MNDLRLNGSDTLAELEAALQRLVAGDFSVRVDVEAGSLGPLSPVVNRLNLLAQTLHFQSQGQAEAMQKAIEEISTQDEELRSSIEELERRNELVESRNQQLLATTRALQANNIEIRALKDDLSNILSSVRIPIVLVSPTGVIRRFNSAASSVFHLTPIDIGRNIGELRLGVEIKRLNDSISDIFANLAPQEFEVQDRQGKWHNLQLRPYITCENVIDGVVMVLIDIDAAKRLGEREVTKVRNELQTLKMDHEELIDSLLFSRLFFENSPSGLNLCQADGQWIASNPALLNMLGYTSEDAIGLTYSKLMPSNHAPAKENPLLRLAIDDRYGPYETEFMRKDGSLIPVRLNGFMVEKDGQKYFWSMVEDLTEIRRLENEAIDQDAILATVIENTPAMIAYWNKDLECVFSNHEYLKWFGLSPGQMKGMPLVKVLGPDLFKTHLPYIQAVLGGENQCFERALVKPDGEVAHAWIQYVAHYRDGAVQGYFVLGTDVTELKKIQETLRVSEVFASSILNSMSEEIVVLDRNGAIVAVNE